MPLTEDCLETPKVRTVVKSVHAMRARAKLDVDMGLKVLAIADARGHHMPTTHGPRPS